MKIRRMLKSIRRNLTLELLAVIGLLGLLEDFPERNGLSVLLDFFQTCCSPVGQHEVRLGDPQSLQFLLRFHYMTSKWAFTGSVR